MSMWLAWKVGLSDVWCHDIKHRIHESMSHQRLNLVCCCLSPHVNIPWHFVKVVPFSMTTMGFGFSSNKNQNSVLTSFDMIPNNSEPQKLVCQGNKSKNVRLSKVLIVIALNSAVRWFGFAKGHALMFLVKSGLPGVPVGKWLCCHVIHHNLATTHTGLQKYHRIQWFSILQHKLLSTLLYT